MFTLPVQDAPGQVYLQNLDSISTSGTFTFISKLFPGSQILNNDRTRKFTAIVIIDLFN